MKDMFFSIIIPLYNKEDSILDTVNSVLQQTYMNFELLIVNDGSTDNSVDILEDNISDKRMHIINQLNFGVSAARNLGVKKATYDYILFLDADDILLKNALNLFLNLINKYPQAQIFTSNMYINQKNSNQNQVYCKCKVQRLIKDNYKEYWLKQYCIRTGNSVFRKEVLINGGLFDVKISYFEDLSLNMRLLENSLIAYTPSFTFVYNNEYSTLSKGSKSITETFAYWLDLKNKSFWHKMILAMNLHTTLRNLSVDTYDYEVLKMKYRLNIYYILLSRILIKLQ